MRSLTSGNVVASSSLLTCVRIAVSETSPLARAIIVARPMMASVAYTLLSMSSRIERMLSKKVDLFIGILLNVGPVLIGRLGEVRRGSRPAAHQNQAYQKTCKFPNNHHFTCTYVFPRTLKASNGAAFAFVATLALKGFWGANHA